MADNNEGGNGPAKDEHLKLIKGSEALITGHLDGLAEEMGDEGKKLVELAKSQLLAGFLIAEKAVKEHLPDGE